VPDSGDFLAYYLRRIGVVAPLAEALSRKGQGSAFVESAHASPAESTAMTDHPMAEQVTAQASPAHSPTHPAAHRDIPAKPPADVLPVSQPSPEPAADKSSSISLASLREAASVCTACDLSGSRKQVVFGAGCEQPDVLFIGEAPGQQEDETGEPFVGAAGQIFDKMLTALHWSRQHVYIMNAIKCRPPGNRDPLPAEMQACSHWLNTQLDLLQPRAICLLGRVAAQQVLQTGATLSSLRGRWHEYRGVPVWVTYHPGYLLRKPGDKSLVWQDLRQLAQRCDELKGSSGAV